MCQDIHTNNGENEGKIFSFIHQLHSANFVILQVFLSLNSEFLTFWPLHADCFSAHRSKKQRENCYQFKNYNNVVNVGFVCCFGNIFAGIIYMLRCLRWFRCLGRRTRSDNNITSSITSKQQATRQQIIYSVIS